MSIKIYNGFKFGVTYTHAIHEKAMEFRKWISKDVREKHLKVLAREITSNIDLKSYGGDCLTKDVLVDAWLGINERILNVQKTKERDPEVDFDFEAVLFPDRNTTYGICFSEHKEHIEKFMEIFDCVDYSYWNNTDAPDDISNVEWENRKKIWERLCGSGTFSMNGFTLELLNSYNSFSMLGYDFSECVKHIPSMEERMGFLERKILFDDYLRNCNSIVTHYNYIKLFHEFEKWKVESEEAKSFRKNCEVILPEITQEYLEGIYAGIV